MKVLETLKPLTRIVTLAHKPLMLVLHLDSPRGRRFVPFFVSAASWYKWKKSSRLPGESSCSVTLSLTLVLLKP